MTTLGMMTGLAPTAGATQTDVAKKVQDAKLADAAQGFEAMFLTEMLKPLKTAKEEMGDDSKDQSAGSDTLSSFGTESLAKAIAKGGGMGIAKQIVQKVTLERTQQQGQIRSS